MKRLFFFFLVGTIYIISAFWSQPNLPSKGDTEIYIIYEISVIQILPSRITFDRDLSLSLSLSLSCLSVASTTKEIWSRPSLFLWRRWNRRKSQRLPRSPYPWSLPCRNLGSCRKSQSRKSQSFPRSPWILPCPVGVRNYWDQRKK